LPGAWRRWWPADRRACGLLSAAAARGLTRGEAERAFETFGEEFPEMTEPQLCAWLIEKFS
jgi:hypothetical protein